MSCLAGVCRTVSSGEVVKLVNTVKIKLESRIQGTGVLVVSRQSTQHSLGTFSAQSEPMVSCQHSLQYHPFSAVPGMVANAPLV